MFFFGDMTGSPCSISEAGNDVREVHRCIPPSRTVLRPVGSPTETKKSETDTGWGDGENSRSQKRNGQVGTVRIPFRG